MPHAFIGGPTLCGKTTLGFALAEQFEAKGIRALALDPYDAPWPVTWKCRKIGDFIRKAKESRCCALFVDEAGQLDLRDPDHEWLLTGSRHWGHACHILGQSGIQLSPIARAQVTRLFLFRSTEETADYWRRVFVDDRIKGATTLNRYEFLQAQMFGDVRPCRLTLKK